MRITIECMLSARHSTSTLQVLNRDFYFGMYYEMKYRLAIQQAFLFIDFQRPYIKKCHCLDESGQ